MDENEATKLTSFLPNEEKDENEDGTIKRRLRIQNDYGEHSLHVVVVIEDLRAAIYIAFIAIILFGIVLTVSFTKEDYKAILKQVSGTYSVCAYFDFAPATYVLPAFWCFVIILGFLYSAAAVLRVQIAYLEGKLSRFAYVSLVLAHVYVELSIICFMIIFAVQPNPAKPETFMIHTAPYMNLKIMFCVLQLALVYFGVKVSWVGLNLPRWFHISSIVHLIPLVLVKVIGVIWLFNVFGDMGENLEGKGVWWSVRNNASKVAGTVVGNISGLVFGLLFPLFQALFICRNGVKSHALVIAVSDNRVSSFAENTPESTCFSNGLLANEERDEIENSTIKRRLQIVNDAGERSLHMVVVIEDLRAAFYIAFITIILLGIVLTTTFTKEDYTAILVQVSGITSVCSYFDFPPSTYVLPAFWCFVIILGFLYSAAAVLRVQIAYLEGKLSRFAYVSLVLSHVYVALSIICFTIIFSVQPNPANPETLIILAVPYINLKIMLCVFQVAVVYFGVKVSWVGLNLPRWFRITSIVHIIALVFVNIFGVIWLINVLGDMGDNLEGKGLWWSVRNNASKVSGTVISNISGVVLGLLFPLFQALFICRKGVKSHALVIVVSDNRVSAFAESTPEGTRF